MKQETLDKIGELIESEGLSWALVTVPDPEKETDTFQLWKDQEAYSEAIGIEIVHSVGGFPAGIRAEAKVTFRGITVTLNQFIAMIFCQTTLRRLEEHGLTSTALYKELAANDRKLKEGTDPDVVAEIKAAHPEFFSEKIQTALTEDQRKALEEIGLAETPIREPDGT